MTDPADGVSLQSLARGLSVVRAFDADHPRMTLSEVSRRTGLARATTRRVLHTLMAEGYVATDGREFRLCPRILELGWSYLGSLRLPELVQPHLVALSEQVGESCSVAVLDGTDVVYVARVATRRIMAVAIHVGTRFPAVLTSMGRAMLSAMPAAEREAFVHALPRIPSATSHTITDPTALLAELAAAGDRGFCVVDQELELGLLSIAAPIHGPDGAVVAAVNISSTVTRQTAQSIRDAHAEPLLRTIAAIERDLALTH